MMQWISNANHQSHSGNSPNNPIQYYDNYTFRMGERLGERLGALVKTGALDVGYVKTTLLKTTRPCTLDTGAGFWVPWNGDEL